MTFRAIGLLLCGGLFVLATMTSGFAQTNVKAGAVPVKPSKMQGIQGSNIQGGKAANTKSGKEKPRYYIPGTDATGKKSTKSETTKYGR